MRVILRYLVIADEVFPEAWHSDSITVSGDNVVITRSKVYLSPRLWYLRVNVIEAQDLVPLHGNINNPEVLVKWFLGNVVFEDSLILSLEDKLGQKEECLGKCEVKLSQVERRVLPGRVPHMWYNLVGDSGGFRGRIHLQVSLDGGYHVLDESIQYSSDYRASAKLLGKPSIGVLELGVISASGLMPMKSRDGRGTPDAPKWNEQYTWEETQTSERFKNREDQDPFVDFGDPEDIHALYLLIVLKPDGVTKMGEIQLAVRFSCTPAIYMLQKYSEPLIPEMHYLTPLSIYQLDSLRHQATHILCLKLSRTEPPLGRDVIEYMLDFGSNIWSIRRGRANFEWLITFFTGFVDSWIWFDSVCKWKSPVTTILAHFIFLFIAFLPNVASRLCYYSALPDELDEELDGFPGAKCGDLMKKRYDRLRGIAGRMMMVLGDLATQGERVKNLLSWRDPRATFLFSMFYLVACGVIFFVSMKLLLTLLAFYEPSRADSLL
ncbi:hypothetical protein HID58_048575 [Brassica napus]|uniref:Multiple C2 domain-containing protein n=1 Tax=Brassica napus TaxID=3708 RepID=A0ABQ8B2J2_BRANA|nr:hypothetical protein HID58_048575 [Brassica napus]